MAPNGSRVPNYNVQVMKVNDAAYLRHHLVNYLQPLLESWSGQRNVFDSIMHLELRNMGILINFEHFELLIFGLYMVYEFSENCCGMFLI